MNRPIRLAVLISGGGRSLKNLIDRIASGELAAQVVLVIASKENCGGIAIAEKAGLPVRVIKRKQFDSTASMSQTIFAEIRQMEADLVALAGYLCLIKIPEDFTHRVMNIHPSLVPAFCGEGMYGDNVHQAVFNRGVKVTGCTVHFANNEYDQGPIILQKPVEIQTHHQPDDIARLVFEQECEAYPDSIRMYANGQLRIRDNRVEIHSL